MNQDLEFMRAFREKLRLQVSVFDLEAWNLKERGLDFEADLRSAEAVRCDMIAAEISVYLTSRGVE